MLTRDSFYERWDNLRGSHYDKYKQLMAHPSNSVEVRLVVAGGPVEFGVAWCDPDFTDSDAIQAAIDDGSGNPTHQAIVTVHVPKIVTPEVCGEVEASK